MPIILPGEVAPAAEQDGRDLTPRQIVAELDRFVVGQNAAKRAVAIALRNRWRRQQLPRDMAEEVVPKNIILIGPTGIGKTEIARRLARLARSPFLKIEASKFTEVGYVGRDVESIVRDLTELAVKMVREEKMRQVEGTAAQNAEERLLALLLPERPRAETMHSTRDGNDGPLGAGTAPTPSFEETREKFRQRLRDGRFDDRQVEIEVKESVFPSVQILGTQGVEEMEMNLKDMMPGLFGGRSKTKRVSVAEARTHLIEEEKQRLVDMGTVAREAIGRVESNGIVFLDEIDKVAGREGARGPDVSREGVQRDLLPIVEGTTVNTKYGMVKTDHVLFIAAGAFHVSKPSDLIPELQGRFPIRVEMDSLSEEDLVRILTEPEHALVKQYVALLGTEGTELVITEDAVRRVARYAAEVNRSTENIGARRLHTILERLLDEISFAGPDLAEKRVVVDAAYVERMLADIVKNQDLSRYVL